jgi:thiamine biosynthesis lipoprotein
MQSSAASGAAVVERRLVLMGTEAEVRVGGADRAAALAASEIAVGALERAEARLSTWTETSELARLNRAPVGEPVALSPRLAAELAAADTCRRATSGAFDPGVGPLVDAWGLRQGGRLPRPAELAAARRASGGDGLSLQGDGTAVRGRPGLRIEEGGFGKGAALDAAVALLAADPAVASARLDLGGQVALYTRPGSRARATELAVAHPRDRSRPVVALTLPGGSLATSGNSERGITVAGERRSHVLDPRTGEPAPDFGSLTVWASGALQADCLSTGLYVLGPEAALAWAADHPGVEVLVLRTLDGGDALEAWASAGLEGRLRTLDPQAVEGIRFVSEPKPPAQEAGTRCSPSGSTDKKERRSPGSESDVATHRSRSSRGHRVGAR